MTFYDIFMKPIELLALTKIRKALIPQAQGSVLELGFGTGVNIPYYKNVDLKALDLSIDLTLKNKFPQVKFIEASATNIPLPDQSVDTIVATLMLCSVDDVDKALIEMKRVLKEDGKFIFLEHVLPKSKVMRLVFKKINPLWFKMSQCNLDRETHKRVVEQGFRFKTLKNKSIFKYGIAVKETL